MTITNKYANGRTARWVTAVTFLFAALVSAHAQAAVTLSPTTLPNARQNLSYSQTITAAGGTAPYAFAISAGALPAGLTLSGPGVLSGTPTASGTFNFTVRATDSAAIPVSGTRAYTLTVIAAPTITVNPATLPNGTQNVAYSRTITAAGGTAPYTFAVTAGALPAGLTLSSGGVLSGTPTVNGAFNFTVTATDRLTYTGSRVYALTVAAPVITVSPATLPNARQNLAYSQTITAAGGTAPYTFAVTAGALPAGLTLSSGGVLSGAPTVSGAFPITVTATDAQSYSGARAYTLTVIAAPTITVNPATLANANQNLAYSRTVTASGGTAPYTFAVTAGALPAGLTLSSGGVLSGTPTVSGAFTFTVTATDALTYKGSRAYTLTVVAVPTITVNPATLTNGTQNVAYSRTITAAGGTTPYTFALTAGALPAGLTLSSAGVLSGTPTVNGTFNFTVTATDRLTYTGSRAYTLTVAAPVITVSPATLPNARQNLAYSQTITPAGGTAPYTFAVTAGALPAGLTLSSGGVLSGTPTVSGAFPITVTATDAQSYSGARAYTLTVIAAPTITVNPATLANANQNLAYSRTVTAAGGTAPYTFAVTAGALPAGITLSSGGLLSGTPTVSGSFTFTVTATDALTYKGSRAYTLTVIAAPTITVNPASLPNGNENLAYSQSVSAAGGTAPYTFAVTAGALPAGLTLSSGGVLSGTPTASGSFNFTVTATDALANAGSRNYSLVIGAAPTISVNPASLPNGNENLAYSQSISASGGNAPYSFAVTSGSLPAGLTLSSGGALSGTPTASGSFNFTVTATDALVYTGSQAYTLTISAAPTIVVAPASLSGGNENLAYSQNVTASGGNAPYAFTVTSGSLPAGLTLSSGGVLSGTPTNSGSFNFTVTATDTLTYTGSQAYTLTVIAAPTISVNPASLPNGNENLAYSQNLSGSGGTAPYAFAVSSGTLPAGMSLSSGGVLSGTPTNSGSFNFTVTATDTLTYTGSQAYTLTVIAAPTISVNPASLPNGNENLAYSQNVTASGGNAPYSFAVTSGSLPAGLTLSSGGALSGTPTASGSFNFIVTATDALTYSGNQGYSLFIVAAPTIDVAPASLPNGNENLAYSQNISASGGTAPYTFAVTTGSLPAGLTLSGTGVLSGTPTVSGSFNFTVTATDALTYTGSRSYSLVIGAAPTITINPSSLPNALQDLTYSQNISASGGNAPYSFAVTSGSLPAGVTLSSVGVLSGTPAVNGTFNFTVTATDALTYLGSQSYTLVIGAAPTITVSPSSLPNGNENLAYSQNITAAGGTAPYTFAVTTGSLPAGLTLSSAGVLSGTPTANGTFSFTVTATDAITYTATQNYSLVVDAVPTIIVAPGSVPHGLLGIPYSQALSASGSTGPYTFAVTSGSLPAGLTLSSTGVLSGTPTANGTSAFTVTATDPLTYSGSQNYSMVIEARPDPTSDPTVRNAVQAQVDSMQRLAFAQMQNVNNRLEQLRSCHDSSASMQVQIEGQGGFEAGSGGGGEAPVCDRPVAFWLAGTIVYGADGGGPAVHTPAMTAGADLRVSENLVLGLGIGAGHDASNPGSGADSAGESYSFMGYGSWSIASLLRLEGVLGYSSASLTSERVTSYDGARVKGTRDADQFFGSLTLAGDLLFGRFSLQPYLRTDYESASLDSYLEQGGGRLSLRYYGADSDALQFAGGLRGLWSLPVPFGLLQPMLRFEYRNLDGSDVNQSIGYADGVGGRYLLTVDGSSYDSGIVGFGLGFTFADGVAGSIEYQSVLGTDATGDSMFTADVSWGF